jgi:hypothetical protein
MRNITYLPAIYKHMFDGEGPPLVSCPMIQYIYTYYLHLERVLLRPNVQKLHAIMTNVQLKVIKF